jgi:hypothetical protein
MLFFRLHFCKLPLLRIQLASRMRHTFATLHIAAGGNISWVSKMPGHSSVELTLKKYNRFIPNLTREDGSAFEEIMDSKTQNDHIRGTANFKQLISFVSFSPVGTAKQIKQPPCATYGQNSLFPFTASIPHRKQAILVLTSVSNDLV